MKWLPISLLLVSLILSGCASSDQEKKESDIVLTSYRLIDEQRTDEAISLLESEIAAGSTDYNTRVALASAYAHRGGIKIQDLVPIFSHVNRLKQLERSLKKAEDKKEDEMDTGINIDSFSERSNLFTQNVATLLMKLSQFFNIYSSIPVISVEEAIYLRHAIYLLDQLEDSIAPSEAIYRGILRIVLFKHIIAENLIGNFMGNMSRSSCQLSLQKVNEDIIETGRLMIDILNDISYANPKEASKLKAASDDIANNISNLTLGLTSIIVLDEASNLLLKESAIQQGFGKLIQCNGDTDY